MATRMTVLQANRCSKLAIEGFEQGANMFKRSSKDIRTTSIPMKGPAILLKVTLLYEYWRRSGVFIDNFGHILHLALVFLLLTLSRIMLAGVAKALWPCCIRYYFNCPSFKRVSENAKVKYLMIIPYCNFFITNLFLTLTLTLIAFVVNNIGGARVQWR